MQKQGPENIFTRIPLVNQLVSLGWDAKQLRTSPEWRIPKRPSEAAKREQLPDTGLMVLKSVLYFAQQMESLSVWITQACLGLPRIFCFQAKSPLHGLIFNLPPRRN